MKYLSIICQCVFWFQWMSTSQFCVAENSKPNVVLIMVDDMGYGDPGCYNRSSKIPTPVFDSLAKEGMRFTDFHTGSSICSPSRVAISTGHYPQRWRITSYLAHRAQNERRGMAQWLDPSAPMLARSLQQRGYATGHFGKWHMGGQRDVDDAPPIPAYGFDRSLTNFEGMGPKLLPLTLEPGQAAPKKIWAGAERLGDGHRWMLRSEITGGFVDAALAFVDEAAAAGKPFYVNVWPDDVHSPFWPPVTRWAEGRRARYLAVLEEMDRQLGRLFARIEQDPALRDNTLVVICSDNGPEPGAGSAGPLRGHKTMLYEGGVRSSLVVWGPGLVRGAGTVNRTSVFSAIDLVPSLLQVTNTSPPAGADYDGEALAPTLLGQSDASRSAPIFFRRPPDRDRFYGVDDLPDLAVRSGRFKLLCEYDGSRAQLFDLESDVGEQRDISSTHPEVVESLRSQLLAWHAAMPANRGEELAGARR